MMNKTKWDIQSISNTIDLENQILNKKGKLNKNLENKIKIKITKNSKKLILN